MALGIGPADARGVIDEEVPRKDAAADPRPPERRPACEHRHRGRPRADRGLERPVRVDQARDDDPDPRVRRKVRSRRAMLPGRTTRSGLTSRMSSSGAALHASLTATANPPLSGRAITRTVGNRTARSRRCHRGSRCRRRSSGCRRAPRGSRAIQRDESYVTTIAVVTGSSPSPLPDPAARAHQSPPRSRAAHGAARPGGVGTGGTRGAAMRRRAGRDRHASSGACLPLPR